MVDALHVGDRANSAFLGFKVRVRTTVVIFVSRTVRDPQL